MMRDTVLEYLKGLGLRNFNISQELPFDANGTPLFTKNPKRVYADQEQTVTEPFIMLMNGNDINLESTVVVVYFATDAKQLPKEYSTLLTALKNTKAIDSDTKYYRRISDVSTEFNQDLLITSVELRFERIATN